MPLKCQFCNQGEGVKSHTIKISGNLVHNTYILCITCWNFANNIQLPKNMSKDINDVKSG